MSGCLLNELCCRKEKKHTEEPSPCVLGEDTGMNVDLIFKIAAIGILVSILNIVLTKSGREEMAMMTTLAGVVVVLLMVAKEIVNLFDTVKALFGF